jgi:citrate/tricarballylate utilization protein
MQSLHDARRGGVQKGTERMNAVDTALDKATARAPASCQLRDERRAETYMTARRAMDICNACRYCEGFCAVFPAMTLRREFRDSDLDYLANLCHNCRGCFFSCQYAPPHEFGVNVPKVFAELRTQSYEKYAWPQPLAALFRRNGTIVSLGMVVLIAIVLLLTMLVAGSDRVFSANNAPGSFYAIIPWAVMATIAGGTFCFSLLALTVAGVRFWRSTGGGSVFQAASLRQATADVLTLRNLGGAGGGCNDLDERYSMRRRHFHHAMFYGFVLCFASTSVATFYDHFLGHVAPYPFLSIPVQLGFWGGIGLIAGTCGLAWIKIASDQGPAAPKVAGGDFALLILLASIALTGETLLAVRATSVMGMMLAIHLGAVATLFVFAPYSKMVHGLHRSLALLRNAIERRAAARAEAVP